MARMPRVLFHDGAMARVLSESFDRRTGEITMELRVYRPAINMSKHALTCPGMFQAMYAAVARRFRPR